MTPGHKAIWICPSRLMLLFLYYLMDRRAFQQSHPLLRDRSKTAQSSLQFGLGPRGVSSGAVKYRTVIQFLPGRDTPGPKCKSGWSVPLLSASQNRYIASLKKDHADTNGGTGICLSETEADAVALRHMFGNMLKKLRNYLMASILLPVVSRS